MATMPPTPLDRHRPEVSARRSPTSTPVNALSPSIGTSTSAIGARARPGVRGRSSDTPYETKRGGFGRPALLTDIATDHSCPVSSYRPPSPLLLLHVVAPSWLSAILKVKVS